MSILSLFNLLFNLIFSGILIYLIIRNNQLANQVNKGTPSPKTSLQTSQKQPSLQDSQISQVSSKGNNLGNKLDYSLYSKKPDVIKTTISDTYKKTDSKKEDKEDKIYHYNKELCLKCIKENEGKNLYEIRNCPHCGSENYDTGCIPAIVQKGRPTNCIPKKDFTKEQAFRACVGVSNSTQQCNVVDLGNKDFRVLSYMANECGEDAYYCAYDESDSCSYNLCKLDDYYSYGDKSSFCNCESSKSATEIMGEGWGRECRRGNNCQEYYPLRRAPELWTNNELDNFYRAVHGAPSYMDVPNLDTPMAAMLDDIQII